MPKATQSVVNRTWAEGDGQGYDYSGPELSGCMFAIQNVPDPRQSLTKVVPIQGVGPTCGCTFAQRPTDKIFTSVTWSQTLVVCLKSFNDTSALRIQACWLLVSCLRFLFLRGVEKRSLVFWAFPDGWLLCGRNGCLVWLGERSVCPWQPS